MHATIRKITAKSGQAPTVAGLIETEYLPLVEGLDGFVSYTLVDLGDDVVTSVGVFTDAAGAERANETARAWVAERLAPYVASPLEAGAGPVLVAR